MKTEAMRPEHIRGVKTLLDLCFGASAWSEDSIRSELEKNDSVCTVVTDGGRVVAYLAFEVIADEGSVVELAVDPEYRRRGMARKLLLGAMRDNSLNEIYLEVRESNEPAVRLYESLGFEKAGVRPDYYSDPAENALIMKKTQERI